MLNVAAEHGLVDFQVAVERLKQTTFRMSESLLQRFLEKNSYRHREQA